MKPIDWFLPETDALMQGLAGRYVPTLQEQVEASPFEWGDLNAAQMAKAAEPEPLTAERMLERTPYMSESAARQRLQTAAERGALREVEGGYALTEDGRAAVAAIAETATASLRELDGDLPEAARLAELLGRQVTSICAAPGIEAPCIQGSRSFDPGPAASAPERLRRYLIDLNSWRDDAHVAAWRQHVDEGHAWEAFSHVWGEKTWGEAIRTPEEAAEKFGAFRGYEARDYQTALDGLVGRGWLESDGDGGYRVTETGRETREAAEADTDRFYFGPMQLEPAEAEELRELLRSASQRVQQD